MPLSSSIDEYLCQTKKKEEKNKKRTKVSLEKTKLQKWLSSFNGAQHRILNMRGATCKYIVYMIVFFIRIVYMIVKHMYNKTESIYLNKKTDRL